MSRDMIRDGVYDVFLVFALERNSDSPSKEKGGVRRRMLYKYPKHVTGLRGMEGDLEKLAKFALPRPERLKPVRFHKSASYVFTVTLSDGSYVYGFCRRLLPPGAGGRYDIGTRYPEVLCFMSHRGEFDLFHSLLDCLETRRIVDPESCEPFLEALYGVSCEPEQVFTLKSASCKVLCEYLFRRPRMMEQGNPALIFNYLTPKMLTHLIGAVMCERRVIFVAQRESTLSDCIHGVIALIYPFKWQHIFIPILPRELLEYAGAPSPYVIGVLSAHKEELLKFPLGDVIFVELDHNRINQVHSSKVAIPIRAFGYASGKPSRTRNDGPLEQRASSIFFNELSNVYSRWSKMGEAVESQLRLIWLAFTLNVFAYVTQYSDQLIANNIDKARFLQQVQDEALQTFLREFLQTQMFDTFIQERFEARRARKMNPGIYKKFDPNRTDLIGMSLYDESLSRTRGDYGFNDIRRALKPLFHQPRIYSPIEEVKSQVTAVVSSSTLVKNPDTDARFQNLSRATYNAVKCNTVMDVLWKRVQSCYGRNWKYGYNGLILLVFLCSAGSEMAVASTRTHMDKIFQLISFKTESIGVAKDAGKRVQDLARQLYRILNDKREIYYLRSPAGHRLLNTPTMINTKVMEYNRTIPKWAQLAGMKYANGIPKFEKIHELLRPGIFEKTTEDTDIPCLAIGMHLASNDSADLLGLDTLELSPTPRPPAPPLRVSETPAPPPLVPQRVFQPSALQAESLNDEPIPAVGDPIGLQTITLDKEPDGFDGGDLESIQFQNGEPPPPPPPRPVSSREREVIETIRTNAAPPPFPAASKPKVYEYKNRPPPPTPEEAAQALREMKQQVESLSRSDSPMPPPNPEEAADALRRASHPSFSQEGAQTMRTEQQVGLDDESALPFTVPPSEDVARVITAQGQTNSDGRSTPPTPPPRPPAHLIESKWKRQSVPPPSTRPRPPPPPPPPPASTQPPNVSVSLPPPPIPLLNPPTTTTTGKDSLVPLQMKASAAGQTSLNVSKTKASNQPPIPVSTNPFDLGDL